MKDSEFNTILIKLTEIETDPRRKNDPSVAEIAASVQRIGLINPITVFRTERIPSYRTLAGEGRYWAYVLLERESIPAHLVDANELSLRLVALDENLQRKTLSFLERSEYIAERCKIIEMVSKGDPAPKISETVSRTLQEAELSGFSQRTVQHDIQIATKISQEVRDFIRTTSIANRKRELISLAREPLDQQLSLAHQILERTAIGKLGTVIPLQTSNVSTAGFIPAVIEINSEYKTEEIRLSTPSAILNKCPIDMIELVVSGQIYYDWLSPCHMEYAPPKRNFPPRTSIRFKLPNGAKITIYASERETRVQLNPSAFASFHGLIQFLQKLFLTKYDSIYVSKLAIHIDVPIPLQDVWKTLLPKGKRTNYTHGSGFPDIYRSGADITELNLTRYLGNPRGKQLKAYDSSWKHGFPSPTSRLEITDVRRNNVEVSHPDFLSNLINTKIFSEEFSMFEVLPATGNSEYRKEQYDEFMVTVESKGLFWSVQEHRGKNPNFDRDKDKIFTLHPKPYDLDELFRERIDRFLKEPISEVEELIWKGQFDAVPSASKENSRRKLNPETRLETTLNHQVNLRRALTTSFAQLYGNKVEAMTFSGMIDDEHFLEHDPTMPIPHFENVRAALIELFETEGWDANDLKTKPQLLE